MSYALIEQWHKRAVSVERLCRVLGVVRIHAPLLDTPTQPVNPLKPA